jgi:sulfur carrier protein
VIRVNGRDRDVSAASVAELVATLGIDSRGVAVALDGEVVRRSAWDVTAVPEGANVEIVTAAAGG